MPTRLFLLSPASVSGIRAKQLTSPRATFGTAMRYRSAEGVAIGEAFAFMSALYFRGKIAYAGRFASPPPGVSGIHVIAPGFGLVSPDWRLDAERMKKLRATPVDTAKRSYVRPLREHVAQLAALLGDEDEVVLLGSVATGKYLDVLAPLLGPRLRFPALFAGLGDMSRGGLMLRAVREGLELDYVGLDAPRRRR